MIEVRNQRRDDDSCSHDSPLFRFAHTATVPVQAQMGTGPYCINDLMCASVPGAVERATCLGCPKKDEDSTTTGDCEFTLPEDSADTSKDGTKDGKSKSKDKKSRRRRRLTGSGDDDDDTDDDGTTVDGMVYNANCCDCDCIQKTEDQACTCICYGFIDPTDSTTIGGSSKDGKSKSKDKKSRRRRRLVGSEDEEDLTVHDEETHVRSRLAKRADNMDAEAAEGGWHSWLLNSLWGSDDEELEVIDQSNRKLKKGKGGKGSKKKSSDDGDDDGGQTAPPTNEDGTTICPEPPKQCFYIKRREGNGATVPEEAQCQINTVGRCAMRGDFSLG